MERLPLLLLPGLMCDERLWAPQIDALKAGVESVQVADLTGERTIEALAASVLEQAPPDFFLAGLSMGGIVAFEVIRQAPERVARLALLDTNARPEAPERKALRDEQMKDARDGKLEYLLREELKPRYLAEENSQNQAILDLVLDMGMTLGPAVFERQSSALRDRPDSRDTLASIACPTLVLCGEDDALCPVHLHQEIATGIRDAELVVLPRCGHLSTLEQPRRVSDAMRNWIQRPGLSHGKQDL